MDTSAPKMEARAGTADAHRVSPGRRPASSRAEDPFRLGFRLRRRLDSDGREVFEQIPLTAEDLVYPEEDDHVSQGVPHFSFLHPWAEALRYYLEKRRPGIVVTSDVLLVLRHDGRNCGPDIAVIDGDFDLGAIDGGINLRAVGGRLVFALEAVSTTAQEIEDKDLKDNLRRYAAEGVEEYFTLYPKPGRKVSNLVGRRLGPAGEYVEIAPESEGRVKSERLGLTFSIDAESEELVVVDVESGERLRLLDERLAEETAARQQAEAERRQALEDVERLKAQLRQFRK